MSEASIARAFLEASDAAAALAARARRRVDAPAVGASDGSPGSVSASMDAEVDAYVARVKAHAKLKACVDAMTHAQRWEDANEALEALEIDLARRIESTFEALARGTRELEDALVDAKATPDVFTDFTPRGAVERGRRGREIWNENILAATREPRDENSDEAIEAASDDAIEALGGDENDGMERELTHDEAVEHEPSPRLGRRLSAEDAAMRIQAVFRGFRSRSRTNIEARRELEHLGMIASAKHSQRKFNDFSELKRRNELRSRSAKQLADLEANIRRDLLSSRRESIKDEIKAVREAQALDIIITDDNAHATAITSNDEDVPTRLCRAVEKYRRRWADCSQVSLNAFDIDHVRSSVLQEVTNALRAEIEDEARALEAQNKKTKVGKKKKGSAEAPGAKKSSSTKSKAAPSKKSKGAIKQQRQRGMETIDPDLLKTFARLQMVEPTPLDGRLDDYLGTGGERRKGHEDSTMLEVAQLRHVLAVSVAIPLTSQRVHELAPHMKCVLLEGLAASGKSYLARLCAAESGCALFNLSPDRLARAEASGENPKSLMKYVFPSREDDRPERDFHSRCRRVLSREEQKNESNRRGVRSQASKRLDEGNQSAETRLARHCRVYANDRERRGIVERPKRFRKDVQSSPRGAAAGLRRSSANPGQSLGGDIGRSGRSNASTHGRRRERHACVLRHRGHDHRRALRARSKRPRRREIFPRSLASAPSPRRIRRRVETLTSNVSNIEQASNFKGNVI